jgi:hypothetical protein
LKCRHGARVASQRDALTGETAVAPAGERSVPDHESLSVCAAPRRRTSQTPMPTQRCTGFPLAATS